MKKGQVYEGRVLQVEFPNKGIVNIDDKSNNKECDFDKRYALPLVK